MLKVYTVESYISIDGEPWQHVGWNGDIVADNKPAEKVFFEYFTFEQCYEYLKEHRLDGIWSSVTAFRHKPIIYIGDGWFERKRYTIFNTISYKYTFTEWKSVTLDWIMKHASADQCIQYLKERGITTCPMNF